MSLGLRDLRRVPICSASCLDVLERRNSLWIVALKMRDKNVGDDVNVSVCVGRRGLRE